MHKAVLSTQSLKLIIKFIRQFRKGGARQFFGTRNKSTEYLLGYALLGECISGSLANDLSIVSMKTTPFYQMMRGKYKYYHCSLFFSISFSRLLLKCYNLI